MKPPAADPGQRVCPSLDVPSGAVFVQEHVEICYITNMRRKRPQSFDYSPKTRTNSLNHVDSVPLDAGDRTESQDHDVSGGTEGGMKKWMKKICSVSCTAVLKVLLLAIIVPPFLNYASLQRESASLHPHGEMHAGPLGNKMFVNCSGRGLPVVFMDAPGGYSSDMWSLIQPKVAKFTKVCIYDRAGLGFSEKATPRFYGNQQSNMSSDEQLRPTTENMVADIHHLLKTVSNSTNNIVLVGGGLGATNAQFFARFYDIFGLVLINPFHENMFTENEWATFWYDHFTPSLQVEQVLAFLGVMRLGILSGLFKPRILVDGRFENEVTIRLKHFSCNSQHLSSAIMEHFYMNESLAQLKILQKLRPFPTNISVNLISSKNFSNYLNRSLNKFWFKHQELFAKEVFPQSEQTVVDSDFNAIYFDDVEVIVKAIKQLVQKFRKSVKQSANI